MVSGTKWAGLRRFVTSSPICRPPSPWGLEHVLYRKDPDYVVHSVHEDGEAGVIMLGIYAKKLRRVVCCSMDTISGRGVMISETWWSPKWNTFSSISASEDSTTPDSLPMEMRLPYLLFRDQGGIGGGAREPANEGGEDAKGLNQGEKGPLYYLQGADDGEGEPSRGGRRRSWGRFLRR